MFFDSCITHAKSNATAASCSVFRDMGVSGFWFLVSGFWFLVSGFWFLVSDFWFLVSGFWLEFLGFEGMSFYYDTNCSLTEIPILPQGALRTQGRRKG
jgi:hypothetical protein